MYSWASAVLPGPKLAALGCVECAVPGGDGRHSGSPFPGQAKHGEVELGMKRIRRLRDIRARRQEYCKERQKSRG